MTEETAGAATAGAVDRWGVLALVYVVSYFPPDGFHRPRQGLMRTSRPRRPDSPTMAALYLYIFAAPPVRRRASSTAWGPARRGGRGAPDGGGALLFSAPGRSGRLRSAARRRSGSLRRLHRNAESTWPVYRRTCSTLAGLTQLAGNTGALLSATPLAVGRRDAGGVPPFPASRWPRRGSRRHLARRPRPAPGPSSLLPRFSSARDHVLWKNPRTWPMFLSSSDLRDADGSSTALGRPLSGRRLRPLGRRGGRGPCRPSRSASIVGAPLVGHLSVPDPAPAPPPVRPLHGALRGPLGSPRPSFRRTSPLAPSPLLLLFGFASSLMLLSVCPRARGEPLAFSGIATGDGERRGFLERPSYRRGRRHPRPPAGPKSWRTLARRYPVAPTGPGSSCCFRRDRNGLLLILFTETSPPRGGTEAGRLAPR